MFVKGEPGLFVRGLQVKNVVAAFRKAKVEGPEAKCWAGRCYEIACTFVALKIVEGIPRYGHWRGPTKKGTPFYRKFAAGAPIHHGWVELPDGRVCDPTRWVFEGRRPYIFTGADPEEYYDVGGDKMRFEQLRPKPVYNPQQDQYNVKKSDLAYKFLFEQFGLGPYCLDQVFWLSNLPRSMLGNHIAAVYDWIEDIGHRAYIPIDNRRMVDGEVDK